MTIERIFLGWDGPLLPRVAAWLKDHYARSGVLDLEDAVIVAPGGRAGRRLLELLAATSPAFLPPRVVTAGELPELLYRPALPSADPLTSLLAWAAALKTVPKKSLAALLPSPPEDDDVAGWLDVAEDLAAVADALAADRVAPGDVVARVSTANPGFVEDERWNAIARVHREYLTILKREGVTDLNEARLAALGEAAFAGPREFFLLGVAELNGTTRGLLERAAAATSVRALVHAPESEKDSFDAFGCPLPEAWSSRRIAIAEKKIRVVDQPRDETMEVLRAIGNSPSRSVDEITIGLGDESAADPLVRGLNLAGIPARPPSVCDLKETAPWLLVSGLARLSESRAFRDLASLFRHPDIERHLKFELKSNLPADWLARVDATAAESAPLDASGPFPGKDSGVARTVAEAVIALAPSSRETRTLSRWPETITGLLRTVYGARSLDRWNESDRVVIESLERIAGGLSRLESVPDAGVLGGKVSFAIAVEMLRRVLEGESIPAEGGEPAIEMLGWLELALDDAPRLIITDFNERLIPKSVTSDPFLPDSLRRLLGLADNTRRYARDAYLLTAILASRPEVTLIGARRDASGNPRVPSRLLLACDDEILPERLAHFYEEGTAKRPASILRASTTSELTIPAPEPREPPSELRVTAFRDFIACPYRFYLRHILGLRSADEPAEEWTRATFGTTAHEALRIFGEKEAAAARPSTNAREIADFLSKALDDAVEERMGRHPPPAILIQKEILRARLRQFAETQARLAAEGWKVEEVEKELTTLIETSAGPFRITGHIDRIDRRENGEVRILDYKTGDSGEAPEKKHRTGGAAGKRWIDLQLPLYRRLLLDREDRSYPEEISLGFVVLGKDPSKIQFAAAPWSLEDLAQAEALAAEIVREILEGRFWRPEDVPRFDDGFGYICMDDFIDRNAVIENVTRRQVPKVSRLERGR